MSVIADPATWWLGHISGALFKTQVADPVNAFADEFDDTGYITTGILTAANGSTITSQKGRVIGNRAFLRVSYTIGGTAVTALGAVGTTGALNNTSVLNVVDARFQTSSAFASQALPSATAGRSAVHVVQTDDTVKLCSVSGSAAISAGDVFSFSGSYLLD